MSTSLKTDLTPFLKDVDYLVGVVMRRLPSSVNADDLRSAGYLGLVDAAHKFDNSQQNTFRTYAMHRVKGAIYDELRRADPVPRQVRADLKKLKSAVEEHVTTHGRPPEEGELAALLGFKPQKLQLLREWERAQFQAVGLFEDLTAGLEAEEDSSHTAEARVQFRQMLKHLDSALDRLGDRESAVLRAVYLKERLRADVAQELGVTESRVSQIVAAALQQLRKQTDLVQAHGAGTRRTVKG